MDYIYLNYEKWKTGKDNVLYVTGLSGSGKTTLSKNMEKRHNAIWIELDMIEHNIDLPNCPITKGNLILREYFDKHGYREYLTDADDEAFKKTFRDVYIFLLDYARKHPNQLFIFEGIQVYTQLHAKEDLGGRPIIIVGTSKIQSFIRRISREHNNSFFEFIKDINIPMIQRYTSLYSWYTKHDKYVEQFKERSIDNIAMEITQYMAKGGKL